MKRFLILFEAFNKDKTCSLRDKPLKIPRYVNHLIIWLVKWTFEIRFSMLKSARLRHFLGKWSRKSLNCRMTRVNMTIAKFYSSSDCRKHIALLFAGTLANHSPHKASVEIFENKRIRKISSRIQTLLAAFKYLIYLVWLGGIKRKTFECSVNWDRKLWIRN